MDKEVKVSLTFEVNVKVPEDWDEDQIDFWLNGSSWCASNSLKYLEKEEKEYGCLCGCFKGGVINEI